jgi:hypothetical protein
MSIYSPHKVKAYFGESNRETREDIRQDLLSERYSDILAEKLHLEKLLGIISKEEVVEADERDHDDQSKDLYEITEILCDMIEMMIPELVSEEEKNTGMTIDKDDKPAEKSDVAKKNEIKKRLVDREKKAQATLGKRGKDTYTKSRHALMKAQIKYDKANNPASLKTAKAGLDSARKKMANVRHK